MARTSRTSLGANFTPTSPVLSLGGASVTIGGLAAPITYASPTQLDVQVPFEIAAGVPSVNVVVTVGGASSAPYMLNVVAADLGMAYVRVGTQIFTYLKPTLPSLRRHLGAKSQSSRSV